MDWGGGAPKECVNHMKQPENTCSYKCGKCEKPAAKGYGFTFKVRSYHSKHFYWGEKTTVSDFGETKSTFICKQCLDSSIKSSKLRGVRAAILLSVLVYSALFSPVNIFGKGFLAEIRALAGILIFIGICICLAILFEKKKKHAERLARVTVFKNNFWHNSRKTNIILAASENSPGTFEAK